MFCLNDTMRYYLCPGRTDMRKGISSLCGVVHEKMRSVNFVSNTVCRYHDNVEGAFVLRQFTICIKLVLQVLGVIIVYGEVANGMFHLADVRKAVGPLHY